MNPAIYDQLVETLRREPQPLAKLHALAVDAGSTWSVEQLHLLFACMDGIDVQSDDAGTPIVTLGQRSLQDELAHV